MNKTKTKQQYTNRQWETYIVLLIEKNLTILFQESNHKHKPKTIKKNNTVPKNNELTQIIQFKIQISLSNCN